MQFLPTSVRPIHYNLTIIPDLPGKKFFGEVEITVEIRKPTKTIKLHQKNLDVHHESTLRLSEDASGRTLQVSGTVDDHKEETLVLRFAEDIPRCEKAVLFIRWTGRLTKEMAGLYRTTYFDEHGRRRGTVSTHFEPTNARRCFPCFDEPKLKATFAVKVVMEARYRVLSNMPPETMDNIMPNVIPPMREWRFQTTPPMSTYLLAITAGEWDCIEHKSRNGTLVRTWAPLGKLSQVELSAAFAVRVLDFFDEYFAQPYVLPKLDLVPVENFPAAAMENWGLILFGRSYLCVNEATSAEALLFVKEVVAHEIAHMWFGNLVTPRFWDSLWLKEGFATYFAFFACDALEPDGHWKTRYLTSNTLRGKELDALTSTHALETSVSNSGEAHEVFDLISYNKGSAMISFIESYIGPEAVRDGLRKYVEQFKYKNAASLDLWLALMKAANVQGPSVKDFMKDWVKQEGYPIVSVERLSPKELKLTQKRFGKGSEGSQQKWVIPLRLVSNTMQDKLVILEEESTVIPIDAATKWVVVNHTQRGFVTVNYVTQSLKDGLIEQFSQLEERDKVGIINDFIALFKAQHLTIKDLLSLFRVVGAGEAPPVVWRSLCEFWVWVSSIWEDELEAKQALQRAGRALFAGIWKQWGISSKSGEDSRITGSRALLISALAASDEKEVLLAVQQLMDANGPLGVDKNLRRAVWSAVVAKGHRPSLDALIALIERGDADDNDVEAALASIQKTRNPIDIQRHFNLALPQKDADGKEIASKVKSDLVCMLAYGLRTATSSVRAAGLSFIHANWNALVTAGGGPQSIAEAFFHAFDYASDEVVAKQLEDFASRLDDETKSLVKMTVKQVAEDIRLNAALKKANTESLKQQ